jgi:molybdenum cofactor biosynthesis enzyme MoaA
MEVDLKRPMREGASDNELKKLILQAIENRPKQHQFYLKESNGRQMLTIGG